MIGLAFIVALAAPGAQLVQAERQLATGNYSQAQALAEAVLADWPESARARFVLARLAHERGQKAKAKALLAEVEAGASKRYARHAARIKASLDRKGSGRVYARVASMAQHDSDVTGSGLVGGAPTEAWRSQLSAEAGWRFSGDWTGRFGGGVNRTLHFTGGEVAEGADRTHGSMGGRLSLKLDRDWRMGARAEALGALAGRESETLYVGAGLGTWLRYVGSGLGPFVELRGLGLRYRGAAEQIGGQGVGDLAAGLSLTADGSRMFAAGVLRVVGPDPGFFEAGGDVGAMTRLWRFALLGRVGFGWRGGDEESLRPRAALGLRLPIAYGFSASSELLWRSYRPFEAEFDSRDRLLLGLGLEWRR